MDLILDKLGRIEHAEIEIRPLTVFVGENNTNKTWAAYCLYGLARSQARNPDITTGFSSDDTPTARPDDEVAGNVDGLARAAREAIAHGRGARRHVGAPEGRRPRGHLAREPLHGFRGAGAGHRSAAAGARPGPKPGSSSRAPKSKGTRSTRSILSVKQERGARWTRPGAIVAGRSNRQ